MHTAPTTLPGTRPLPAPPAPHPAADRLRSIGLAGLGIAAATSLLAAGWHSSTPPSAATLDTFMDEHYGRYDSTRRAWPGPTPAGRPSDARPCAVRPGTGPAPWLVAVCSTPRSGGSQAEAARLDLYQLRPAGRRWQVMASRLALATGAFGEPGQITIVQLGEGWFGFAVQEHAVGQGQSLGTLRLHAPTRGDITTVLALHTDYDNEGTGACDTEARQPAMPACRRIERRWTIEPAAGAGDWTIRIDDTRQLGAKASQATHRLRFDAALGRYPLPPSLPAWLG
ncbi:MAG: hypothetical protein HY855_13620 [Burkholderiales bacterium]|nr:hypothetical protein [Burkholderiales bacterium]